MMNRAVWGTFVAIVVILVDLCAFAGARTNRNHALILDGVDDYVTVPDTVPLRLSAGSFSFGAWLYLESYGSLNYSIVYKRSGDPIDGYTFAVGGTHYSLGYGRLFFYQVIGGGTPVVHSNQEIPLREWTHVALVHHADTQLAEIYINGELDNEMPNVLTPGISNTVDLFIGKDSIPNAPLTTNYHGRIDEIQFWSKALTKREIKALKRRHLSGREDGLIGYWDFKHGEIKDHCPLRQNTIPGDGVEAEPEDVPSLSIRPAVSLIATNCLPTSEYELQFSTTLLSNDWHAITRDYRAIGGGDRIYSDPVIDPKRYYRLVPIDEE